MKTARRFLIAVSFAFAVGFSAPVWACPMCNQAIQEDKSLPVAYQASIIFMLAMPFTVVGGLGSLIYFKFRGHERALLQASVTPPATASTPASNESEPRRRP